VAMEALASGTPVIAFRCGALPDIVDHGRTGFLVSTTDGMSRALLRVHALEPEICRTVARERYSAQTMADRYLRLYEALIYRGKKTAEGIPGRLARTAASR